MPSAVSGVSTLSVLSYHNALGSARETLSCLEVAAVFGYVHEDAQLNDQLNRVVGTLVRLVRV